MIFPWIPAEHSSAIFYHLAEPKEEVNMEDRLRFKHLLTAVGQLLSLCLMALWSKRWSGRWRNTSIRRAQTWSEHWEKILHDIPQEDREIDPPPPSAFTARRYPIIKQSPYSLRRKNPRSHPSGWNANGEPTGDDNEGSDPPGGSEQGLGGIDPKQGIGCKRGEAEEAETAGGPQSSFLSSWEAMAVLYTGLSARTRIGLCI